jgi:hypothetical protein
MIHCALAQCSRLDFMLRPVLKSQSQTFEDIDIPGLLEGLKIRGASIIWWA